MTDGGSSGARWLRTFNTSRNRWHAAAPVAYLKGAELHGAISLRSIPRVRPHRAFEERPSIDGLWGHFPPQEGGRERPRLTCFPTVLQFTRAIASPSQPLTPTVCIAVALTRGSAASVSKNLRTPRTSGSRLLGSATAPSRTTLSTTITAPDRLRRNAHEKYAELFGLSASMKTKSKGAPPSVARIGSVSSAAPTLRSMRSARPARPKLPRATSARRGSASSVTSRPCGGNARASQIVL